MEQSIDVDLDGEIQNWRTHYFPFVGHHFILPGGHALHYVDEGPRDGEVVILLHGNPTWSFYWRHLIAALKDKYRVIALDHLGCGESSRPQDYSYRLADHIQNLQWLVESLKVTSLTLVVHDWGGAIGLGYATRFPEKIKRLVITNTAAFTSKDIPWRIALCKTPKIGEWIIRGANGFAWPATFMAVKKKMPASIRKLYLWPYNNYQNRVAIHKFVQDIPLDSSHPSYATLMQIERKLPELRHCRKIILWGAKDFCFNQKFLQRWMDIYPEARVKVFTEAGHYLMEDAREEVVAEITSFLNDKGVLS